MRDRLLDVGDLLLRLHGAVDAGQHIDRFAAASLLDEPARAFGHQQQQDQPGQRRKGLGAEHPPPAGLHVPGFIAQAGDEVVDE